MLHFIFISIVYIGIAFLILGYFKKLVDLYHQRKAFKKITVPQEGKPVTSSNINAKKDDGDIDDIDEAVKNLEFTQNQLIHWSNQRIRWASQNQKKGSIKLVPNMPTIPTPENQQLLTVVSAKNSLLGDEELAQPETILDRNKQIAMAEYQAKKIALFGLPSEEDYVN